MVPPKGIQVGPYYIVPDLAIRDSVRLRLVMAYAIAFAGYALGLFLAAGQDLTSGAAVVWALAAIGVVVFALEKRGGVGSNRLVG